MHLFLQPNLKYVVGSTSKGIFIYRFKLDENKYDAVNKILPVLTRQTWQGLLTTKQAGVLVNEILGWKDPV